MTIHLTRLLAPLCLTLLPTLALATEGSLELPQKLDPSRPLVILVPGLYSGRAQCADLDKSFEGAGLQVAHFDYSSNQPLAESAAIFTKELQSLHTTYPKLRLDLIGHSMGGLIARAYVEGKDYMNDVDHLFLIATPNKGTAWARLAFVMEYNATKKVTTLPTKDSDCAAGDLLPGSKFLTELAKLQRREGVKYTTIAGNRNEGLRVAAGAIDTARSKLHGDWSSRWGLRHVLSAATSLSETLRDHPTESDGVVAIESAQLEGVKDAITLPASHNGLVWKNGENPPPVWPTIRDRLVATGRPQTQPAGRRE